VKLSPPSKRCTTWLCTPRFTGAVKEQVTEQNWALYPIVYMDCTVVKVRQDGNVINKAVFLALGINAEGQN
jgi:putative transposase